MTTDPNVPSAEVRARILDATAATPSPTRRERLLRSALLLAAGLATAFVVLAARGLQPGEPRPSELMMRTAGGAALLTAAMAWISLGRGRSMLGRPRGLLLATILLAPLALFTWKVAMTMPFPEMLTWGSERVGLRCLQLSLAMGLAPIAALLAIRRGTAPLHPSVTGAALGMASGAIAWVLVDVWCPVATTPHLVIGHLLPLVLFTLAGAGLGRLVLVVRRPGRHS